MPDHQEILGPAVSLARDDEGETRPDNLPARV